MCTLYFREGDYGNLEKGRRDWQFEMEIMNPFTMISLNGMFQGLSRLNITCRLSFTLVLKVHIKVVWEKQESDHG
jgi:hypothetical protein